jgi:hypothetical protein
LGFLSPGEKLFKIMKRGLVTLLVPEVLGTHLNK